MGTQLIELNKQRRKETGGNRKHKVRGRTASGQPTRGRERKGLNTCLYYVHNTSFAFDLSATAGCNYCYHQCSCIPLPEEGKPDLFSMQNLHRLSVERKKKRMLP